MTLPALRVVMEKNMLIGQVRQVEILGGSRLPTPRPMSTMRTHLEEFTEPATVTLREMLIGGSRAGRRPQCGA